MPRARSGPGQHLAGRAARRRGVGVVALRVRGDAHRPVSTFAVVLRVARAGALVGGHDAGL